MSSKFLIRVPYLEGSDINSDGSLKSYVGRGKPVVMMVQGNFCGYCTQAKPDFQSFARNNDGITAVTVQIDGEESDKKASQALSSVNTARGVPAYLGFDKNGKFVKIHSGNRDEGSIKQFASSL